MRISSHLASRRPKGLHKRIGLNPKRFKWGSRTGIRESLLLSKLKLRLIRSSLKRNSVRMELAIWQKSRIRILIRILIIQLPPTQTQLWTRFFSRPDIQNSVGPIQLENERIRSGISSIRFSRTVTPSMLTSMAT